MGGFHVSIVFVEYRRGMEKVMCVYLSVNVLLYFFLLRREWKDENDEEPSFPVAQTRPSLLLNIHF